MSMLFNLEKELVKSFLLNFNNFKKEIVIEEMPIRFGNIDIVSIKNTELPFSKEQIQVLSKPSNALVFTKIKNERPISKVKLLSSIGLSETTLTNVLYELTNCKLIKKQDNTYLRETKFIFPKTKITGYEAKLKDFNKAFYQAKNNKEYVDYSYLVFPFHVSENILKKKVDLLEMHGIGLIGVTDNNITVLLKARKTNGISNYIRLLNITKANAVQTKARGYENAI